MLGTSGLTRIAQTIADTNKLFRVLGRKPDALWPALLPQEHMFAHAAIVVVRPPEVELEHVLKVQLGFHDDDLINPIKGDLQRGKKRLRPQFEPVRVDTILLVPAPPVGSGYIFGFHTRDLTKTRTTIFYHDDALATISNSGT